MLKQAKIKLTPSSFLLDPRVIGSGASDHPKQNGDDGYHEQYMNNTSGMISEKSDRPANNQNNGNYIK